MYMNKWIIFIIVVAVVSMIGIGANFLVSYPNPYKEIGGTPIEPQPTIQEPGPVIRFTNISDEDLHIVARGVLVTHDNDFSMDFLGRRPPEAYESLAKGEGPSAVLNLLRETASVNRVFEVATMKQGVMREVTIPLSSIVLGGIDATRMSYIAPIMDPITETTVGMVWLNGYALGNTVHKNDQAQVESVVAEIIEIDTANNNPVRHHPQFYGNEAVFNGVVQITVDI